MPLFAATTSPFAASHLQIWAQQGYLQPTTPVRHLRDAKTAHKPLRDVPLLGGAAAAAHAASSSAAAAAAVVGGEGSGESLAAAAAAGLAAAGVGVDGDERAAKMPRLDDRLAPTALRPGQYREYASHGGWSAVTGRFTGEDAGGDAHWEKKGLSADRGIRMMGHYFDHEGWQQQMQGKRMPRAKRMN